MNETPRTDAALKTALRFAKNDLEVQDRLLDHARELERESGRLCEALEKLANEASSWARCGAAIDCTTNRACLQRRIDAARVLLGDPLGVDND